MNAFWTFVRKDIMEIRRTWRLKVVVPLLLFFAITDPLTSRYMREILTSLMTEELKGIEIPEPTSLAAYQSWMSSLSQTMIFAVIALAAGTLAGERNAGTAQLALTKPLSRKHMVLAKLFSTGSYAALLGIAGSTVAWIGTRLLFGEAPILPILRGTAAWMMLALLFVAITMLASAVVKETLPAVGIGIGAYMVLAIAASAGVLRERTPLGVLSMPADMLTGLPAHWAWPVTTTGVVILGVAIGAVIAFDRQEL